MLVNYGYSIVYGFAGGGGDRYADHVEVCDTGGDHVHTGRGIVN